MNIVNELAKLGFTERESKVYLALLKFGPTTTTKVIRETSIPSSKIYDVLERLESKGFVTHILRKGKKVFQTSNPQKIFDIIKEKEQIANIIVPRLNELYETTKDEVKAEIYKGKEGIKDIFEDILKEKKEWFVLGASGKGIETLPYFLIHFYNRLKNKKIRSKMLFIENNENKKQVRELKKYQNISVKYLPKKIRNLTVTFIYSDKIFMIPITETVEVDPLGILIKSKESANGYRDYFNWLWSLC